jgi:hypothetical protein
MPRIFPDWIDAYMELTGDSEPPVAYRKWCAVSTIASVLQRKCFTEWENRLYPNMYIILVGPSSCRKGSAMRQARIFIDRMKIPRSPEAITREKLIRRLKGAANHVILNQQIAYPHNSLSIIAEELMVFIGYNNNEMLSMLCDWFDCTDDWTYDTKNSGTDQISNIWVNLIGATTPGLIQAAFPPEGISGGLASRMVFIYEFRKLISNPDDRDTPAKVSLRDQLYSDLEQIHNLQGAFIPTEEFLTAYRKWYIYQDTHPFTTDPHFDGYRGRRATHLRKLCMILSASRSNDMSLTLEDLLRAIQELEAVEKNMVHTFRGVGTSDIAGATRDVMATIMSRKIVTYEQLLGIHLWDVDNDSLNRILEVLTTMEVSPGQKFCKWVYLDKEKKQKAVQLIEVEIE